MRRLFPFAVALPPALALILTLILILTLAACASTGASSAGGPPSPISPTASATSDAVVGADVHLGAASFVTQAATIQAGQALRFIDLASGGGPHVLCLGHNQVCAAGAPGPQALQGAGFPIQAGAPPKLVVFAMPGTYQITCTLHPLMNLTVTVR